MAEEDLSTASAGSLKVGLSSDDINPRVYEGGFKTWECSVDLVRYLSTAIYTRALVLENTYVRVLEVRTISACPLHQSLRS